MGKFHHKNLNMEITFFHVDVMTHPESAKNIMYALHYIFVKGAVIETSKSEIYNSVTNLLRE